MSVPKNDLWPASGLAILLVLLLPLTLAASAGANKANENMIYNPSVKCVQLFRLGDEMAAPVIQLGSTEQLHLSFDELGSELRRYRYTIRHCAADWSFTEGLTPIEYIDGYQEEEVIESAYSYNTTIPYVHYRATFPTASMRPRISGNFLLIVYADEPSAPDFVMRFMVVENSYVAIEGKVEQGLRIEDRLSSQSVGFLIKLNGLQVSDVGREVKVVVQQNGRWDNAMLLTRPRFARNDELDYRYDENITFCGGNQFRWFDTKSLLYQSERVARISFDSMTHVTLVPDQPRTFKQYVYEEDLNGRFLIKNEEHAENSTIEADYAVVHFFMPWPALLSNGSFYLVGALTQWRLDDQNRMRYDHNRRGYVLDLLLKQGYYNYQILFREHGKRAGDEAFVEGAHWETENEYTVWFYFREAGSLFDRLMAVHTLSLSLSQK